MHFARHAVQMFTLCWLAYSDPMLLVSDEDVVESPPAPTGDATDTGALLTLEIGTRQSPQSTGVVFVEKEGTVGGWCSTPGCVYLFVHEVVYFFGGGGDRW